jgi:crotonobetainyl-CoA:carnitine CoA-transferase CaiB-like acyl-CoA transferase
MTGALDGILVADFSRVLAGPYATMLLADLGATVIKVERPVLGDDTRAWGPPFTAEGKSTYFEGINRNKSSIILDLDNLRDQKRAKKLIAQSDVMIENFKVGGLKRYGLDFTSVHATNEELIYCSISGFGAGAGRDLPGYDLLVQAMGGLMSITGENTPTKVGVALVDVLTGLHATVAILAALHERASSGRGQLIEVNLLSVLLASMVNQSAGFVLGGKVPSMMGNAHPSIAPYELFQAQDRELIIAVGNDHQFAQLMNTLDVPELALDARFSSNSARVENRLLLKAIIEDKLRGRNAQEWHERFSAVGIPAGPINNLEQSFAFAESLGLNPIVGGQVASPLFLSRTPVSYNYSAPELGVNTQEIIESLDLDNPE